MHNNDMIGLIVIVMAVFLVKLFRGPFGQAIADRIRGTARPDHAVADELEAVKARLAEVEERLDFAERMLAKGDQAERLPGRGTT
jgi:tetrahydromethanopterin S-methyltransferase subunit G